MHLLSVIGNYTNLNYILIMTLKYCIIITLYNLKPIYLSQ